MSEDHATHVVSEAEELLGHVYRRGRIRGSSSPFEFRQRVVGDERANFAHLQIGSKAELALDLVDMVGIGHLRTGSCRATSNGREVDPRESFLLVPGEARSSSESLDLFTVNLDLPQLAVYSGVDRGAARIRYRFDDLAPVSREASIRWRSTVEYCREVLDDPVMLSHDLLRHAAIDTVFAVALTSFRISFSSAGGRSEDEALPAAVRRAQSFIEDNAALPISVSDVAAAARMSVRGLQAAFRRDLATTPQAHLRTVRLSAAHADLAAASADEDTVAEIAGRWGFGHLGRFAQRYRAEFGELPSDTLRR